MPTNTRGGGNNPPVESNSSVCWAGPSDQVGTLYSLTQRVANLEVALARLLGYDLTGLNASDMFEHLGLIGGEWVNGNGLPPGAGWTSDGTFTGVAISTLGWTMSDGNQFPVVTMVDGVLQFGFNTNGTVGGVLPDLWNQASSPHPFGRLYYNGTTWSTETDDMTTSHFTPVGTLISAQINVARSGLYAVSIFFTGTGSGASEETRGVSMAIEAGGGNFVVAQSPLGYVDSLGNWSVSGSGTAYTRCVSGEAIAGFVSHGLGGVTWGSYGLSAVWISE